MNTKKKSYLFKDPLYYPFSLPALDYPYDALEPYFDKQTMELHHTKHHQAYVNGLNTALKDYPHMHSYSLEELLINLKTLPTEIQTAVCNHGGGHKNHSMFWRYLAVGKDLQPTGSLARAIEEQFESFDLFKERFNSAAKSRFGSGWAWLCLNRDNKLVILSTPNQDSPLSNEFKPFLGLDVWEHAYYLKYQNKRVDYINAWWYLVNWSVVEQMYQGALQ